MEIHGTTLEEAAQNFRRLKACKPFQFAGTWYLAIIDGTAYAYLRKHALIAKARKAGIETFQAAVIG